MKIKFLGAAKTVTGSFFLLSTEHNNFAIDCGMFQGRKELKERNYGEFPVDPSSIDFIILTHAHIDHTGMIPKLVKNGFKGTIYCSSATRELVSILLADAGHIQEMEVKRKNRKRLRTGQAPIEPIYTVQDALDSLKQISSLNDDEIIEIEPGIQLRLRDAGHILGSNIVEIWVEEDGTKNKLVFSGDLGNYDQPIIKDPTIIESADYVIMESTYGNRLHSVAEDRSFELKKVIDEAMARGGNLIIPAFAVERTQDLLYDMMHIYRRGEMPPGVEIWLDSPLAIAATMIFLQHSELYDEETTTFARDNDNIFRSMGLKFSRTTEDSMRLNQIKSGAIIISASGMCDAGRIKHHLRHNLWRPESTILFVGYQAEGSLGRRILNGEKMVTIHGEQVAVKAAIASVDYYSAHADKDGLIRWLKGFTQLPKAVFLVHGEEASLAALSETIKNEIQVAVEVPDWMDEYEINAEASLAFKELEPAGRLTAEQIAQNSYLEIKRKLDEYFAAKNSEGKYDEMLELLEDLKKVAQKIK